MAGEDTAGWIQQQPTARQAGWYGARMERWLFVCTGNICRSPLAEAAARVFAGDSVLETASAGTIAVPGNPATRAGISAARELGIDLSAHRATYLTRDVVAGFDRVFGMEEEHVAAVRALDAEIPATLLSPDGDPIPDPYGGDRDDYIASYELILEALRVRLEEWA